MAAASPVSAANPIEYRFGSFRLIPATRELWKDGTLHHVQPLAFDCLVYLLEHRQRVVGCDELASAIWASVDVADAQIRQLVRRARLAVGDDAKSQHVIRTVSGGSYRWVLPVETSTAAPDAVAAPFPVPPDAEAAEDAAAPGLSAPPSADAGGRLRGFQGKRPLRPAIALLLILIGACSAFAFYGLRPAPPKAGVAVVAPDAAAAPDAVIVLPLEVAAPEDAGWVRLGAMDLVAQRLRNAGMPVPPSDNVVSAVLAIGTPDDDARLAKLRRALGAGLVVRGSVTQSKAGWNVELDVANRDGIHHTAQAERPEVTEAARVAADLLAASLGYASRIGSEPPLDLEELLQRARAALLANQTDTARAMLANAPEPLKTEPQVRAILARVEFRAGSVEQAQSLLNEMLADPAAQAQPAVVAQALTTLGFIDARNGDHGAAEKRFDDAISVLGDRTTLNEYAVALAARGLARTGLGRFDDATADLSQAGPLLQQSGDRAGVARVNNYFGQMEIARGRPAEAAPYFGAAIEIYESFGTIEGLRANLYSLCDAHAQSLHWSDALEACDRLWNLRDRLRAPAEILTAALLRTRPLLALGRFGDVERMLRDAESMSQRGRKDEIAYFLAARAEWYWHTGRASEALTDAVQALAAWPGNADDLKRERLTLVCQRAALAIGETCPAAPSAADDDQSPLLLIALGERMGAEGRRDDAKRAFDLALSRAEARGVPGTIGQATVAYGRWLLEQGRPEDARGVAGRVLPWAERDYDIALLHAAVFHALGDDGNRDRTLAQARSLAGERTIPAELLQAPLRLELATRIGAKPAID